METKDKKDIVRTGLSILFGFLLGYSLTNFITWLYNILNLQLGLFLIIAFWFGIGFPSIFVIWWLAAYSGFGEIARDTEDGK